MKSDGIRGSDINQQMSSAVKKNSQAETSAAKVNPELKQPDTDTKGLTLSDDGRAMQQLEAKLKSIPDVDEAKVEAIKRKIAEGSLDILSTDLAKRLQVTERISAQIFEMESRLPAHMDD